MSTEDPRAELVISSESTDQPGRCDSRHPKPLILGLRGAAAVMLLVACALALVRLLAFEQTVSLVAAVLSPDSRVGPEGRREFSMLLIGGAIVAAGIGTFLIGLCSARWRGFLDMVVRWDALRARGLTTPDAYRLLTWSAASGSLIVVLWILGGRLGAPIPALFAKEGFFENVTFMLELAAAVLCAFAARRWTVSDGRRQRVVRAFYALCAVALFVIGMEEINWGQTLLGFESPAWWAEVNYQGETSIHNLVERDALTKSAKVIATLFGSVVIALSASTALAPRTILGAIAPPASFVPLAIIIAAGGFYLHPEVIELLLALFAAFYGYRICVAARSSDTLRTARLHSDPLVEPGVPLAPLRADSGPAPSWWSTELLEYTHDAIIIWEMDGAGILYWNRAAEKLYGYGREEALGRVTHDLLNTRLTGGVGRLEKALARFGIWIGELQHTTRDGRRAVVEARLALLAQHNGRWLVLEVNRDVTDLKIAEAERCAVERQLSHWRRLHRARA